jgi:hypothetical protein
MMNPLHHDDDTKSRAQFSGAPSIDSMGESGPYVAPSAQFLAQKSSQIPSFLIDSAPRLEIAVSRTKQTTKLFLIETETATFAPNHRWEN